MVYRQVGYVDAKRCVGGSKIMHGCQSSKVQQSRAGARISMRRVYPAGIWRIFKFIHQTIY
jgi:hypothetical protein